MIPASGAVASGAVGGLPLAIGVTVSGSASGRALAIASSTGAKISHATGAAILIATGAATGTKISLTKADLDAIADAVWAHTTALDFSSRMMICSAILRNKTVTNPVTGIMTVYADDGVTPYLTAQLHEDVAESQTYRGQGAEVRGRLA